MQRLRRRSRLYKHCAASARKRSCAASLSRPESNAAQQICVAWVVTQSVVIWANGDEDQHASPSLEVPFEPGKRLILLLEASVHRCRIRRGGLSSGVPLLELSQYCHCLSALPQGSVTVSEVAKLLAPSPRQLDSLLQLGHRFLLTPLFQIGPAQVAMRSWIVRIQLDVLFALLDARIEI